MVQVLNIDQKTISDYVKGLTEDLLFAEAQQYSNEDLEKNHQQLLNIYKREEKENYNSPSRYELLNIVLRSAIRVGDFLNLSTFIYKTNKEIGSNPDSFSIDFLVSYYEVTALYHFFENSVTEAIKEIEFVIESQKINNETLERCFYYYVSILIGGYLPIQARDVTIRFKQQYPVLQYNPLLALIEIITAVENHLDKNEIQDLIHQFQKNHQRQEDNTAIYDFITCINDFLEKNLISAPSFALVFPENWEPILRLDLWLKAKLQNKFYYQMILDYWINRRKVF